MKGPAALLFVVLVIAAVAFTSGKKHFRHGTASTVGAFTLTEDDAFKFILDDSSFHAALGYKAAWKSYILFMLNMFKKLAAEREAAADEDAFYKQMWQKLNQNRNNIGFMAMGTVEDVLRPKKWYMEQLKEAHTRQAEDALFTNPVSSGLLEQWNLDPAYYRIIQESFGPVPERQIPDDDERNPRPDPGTELDKSYCVMLVEKYITDREYAEGKEHLNVEERLVAVKEFGSINTVKDTIDVCSHKSFARNARVEEHGCCKPFPWNFDFWQYRGNADIYKKMGYRQQHKLFYVLRYEPDVHSRTANLWPYNEKRVEFADAHTTDWQLMMPNKKAAMKKTLDDFEANDRTHEFGKKGFILG